MPAPDTPHTTNLVAYWPLDEASGASRLDRIGTSHLTNNGTVGQGAALCSYAALFDGATANYLSVADNAALSMGDFDYTVTAWVYPVSNPGVAVYVCKGSSSGAQGQEFQLYHATTFKMAVGNGAGSSATVDSGVSLTLNTWHFLRAWHDASGNVLGIAVNEGTPATTAYSAGGYDSTHEMTVGRYSNFAGGATDGLIERVGLWKRVLSSNDGASLYNSGMCFDPLAPTHPVGMLTELGPWGVPMGRYGSFMGRASSAMHPVGPLTQLGPWGVPMGLYSDFSGRPPAGATGEEPLRLFPILGVGL